MYHGRNVPGFPAHPHYGFETVTIVTNGVVDHSDSLGAAGRFGFGDVQWMTAGSGVQHCEMFPLLHQDKRNPLELFQIWLNLPKHKKAADPYFAMLWSDVIPIYETADHHGNKIKVTVIAGQIESIIAPPPAPDSWAADPANEVAIWTIAMDPNAKWTLPKASEGVNRSLFFYSGDVITIASRDVKVKSAIELDASMEVDLVNGSRESKLLLLQGKPISEPVVQHGPFVVNSPHEVQEVMERFRQTQFGGWPWPSFENVHPKTRPRFAKYPDGHEEIKDL